MAERRMIHANFFTDEFTGELNNQERILWIGLIVSCADDQGRLPNNPAVIRSKVFPYDDISLEDISRSLEKFVSLSRVLAYTVDIRQLIQIVNWWRYQNPSWAEPSVYPPPPGWVDRVRSHKNGPTQSFTENWDEPGGFERIQVDAEGQPIINVKRLRSKRDTAKIKRQLITKNGMICENCKEIVNHLELDHIIPLWLGGSIEDDNLQLLCKNCHLDKTIKENKANPQVQL